MPTRTPRLPLRDLIDQHKDAEHPFGFDEFVKFMQMEKRPSLTSLKQVYGKNYATIKKWVERWEEEKGK